MTIIRELYDYLQVLFIEFSCGVITREQNANLYQGKYYYKPLTDWTRDAMMWQMTIMVEDQQSTYRRCRCKSAVICLLFIVSLASISNRFKFYRSI